MTSNISGILKKQLGEYRHRLRRDGRTYLSGLRSPRDRIQLFSIVANSRTGSTLLVDLLNAHTDIHCDGEVLQTARDYPFLYVRGLAAQAAANRSSAYGFKLNTTSTRLPRARDDAFKAFVDTLAAEGFTFIRLRRRNIVRQGVSVLRAAATVYHQRGTGPGQPTSTHVDIDRLFHAMVILQEHDNQLGLMLEPYKTLEFWYEDDLESESAQQATADAVSRMLGLAPAPATTSLRKLTPPRLQDAISNFDEVERHLMGTKFEQFLSG